MALLDLLDAIESDTNAQIRDLLAAAEVDAARIDADAARARHERSDRASHDYTAELEASADKALATAQRTARAEALAARAAMLDRVHAALRARLPALLDDAVGRALLRAVVACAGGGTGTLTCAPSLVDAAREMVPPGIRVEPDPAIAGASIELAGGTRIVATLDALLDREWPRLATLAVAEVAA